MGKCLGRRDFLQAVAATVGGGRRFHVRNWPAAAAARSRTLLLLIMGLGNRKGIKRDTLHRKERRIKRGGDGCK